jgi:hypothetical protein
MNLQLLFVINYLYISQVKACTVLLLYGSDFRDDDRRIRMQMLI